MSPQLEMLKGTLDLMVLQTLEAMGARRCGRRASGLSPCSSRGAHRADVGAARELML
jgi:hypothetical protein